VQYSPSGRTRIAGTDGTKLVFRLSRHLNTLSWAEDFFPHLPSGAGVTDVLLNVTRPRIQPCHDIPVSDLFEKS